jgi:uncharacterized membrane protein HdeD (DUF308 family)
LTLHSRTEVDVTAATARWNIEKMFRRAWWAMALRGLLAIAIGIALLARPRMSLEVLLAMLGGYLIVDGVLALAVSVHALRGERQWWPYLWEGLISIAVGLLALARPRMTALGALAIIAARAIITGVVEIASGKSLREASGLRGWTLWLAGLASIAFGVLLLASPASAIVALVLLAGLYGVVFGALMLAEAFQLRRFELREA